MLDEMKFKTYWPIRDYDKSQMIKSKPYCFNGLVGITEYEITCTEVEASPFELGKRLQDLWDHSGNWHDFEPLKAEAKKIGYELQGSRGSKCK